MRTPWSKAESDLDREVQYHLESLADTFQSQGMSRAEAMREARREFGAVESIKEECRDERWWNPLAQIGRDLRFGWRMMRRAPAITGAAILSLALGIGATTAILSLADVLLWRTLGVPEPEQLSEVLWESKDYTNVLRSSSGSSYKDGTLQVADYFSSQSLDALRAAVASKGEVAAQMGNSKVSASFDGRLSIARLRAVTGNFFSMLHLQPALGRMLNDRDDTATAAPAVVVSHRYWRSQLGARRDVIGRPMRINNHAYEIVGVLPAAFLGIVPGDSVELYAAIRQCPEFLARESWYREHATDPEVWWLHPIVRRAPGVTVTQLRDVMDAAFATSWVKQPETAEQTPHIRLSDASRGLGSIRRNLGNPILILLGLVVLVLAAACANIANLMLARGVSREKEVALRISLGCGRGRLMRQFLTESLLMAAIGGTIGIPVAMSTISMIVHLMPGGGEQMLSAALDPRLLAGTGIVTILAALLFGLYPAWRAVRIDPSPALKEVAGGSATQVRSRWAAARILVLVQVSLCLVLVTAAVLFTSNLWEIAHRDTGFEHGNVLMFDVRPGEIRYQDGELKRFYARLERRLSEVPGVRIASLANIRPMTGGGSWNGVQGPGRLRKTNSAVHRVSARFMDIMGVPIIAGRTLTPREVDSGAKVAIISQDLANQLQLPSPIGAFVTMGNRGGEGSFEIVGVARQARYSNMVRIPPVIYVPFDYDQASATVILRTEASPLRLLPSIREAVKELDSELPLLAVYTMEQQISRTLQRERLFAWLCGSFGVLALVLCMVGLYGLMSHTTARRTHEIGIRMAMGATRGGIILQSLRSGLGLAAGGLILGVPPAVYAMRLAEQQKMIPEGPFPYGSLAVAIGLIALSAILAVLVPALRAASVHPAQALRHG